MTTNNDKHHRTHWVDSELLDKWVICLECGYELFLHSHSYAARCTICDGIEFEESSTITDYSNLEMDGF